jgi:flagellar biosynthesis protein FliR
MRAYRHSLAWQFKFVSVAAQRSQRHSAVKGTLISFLTTLLFFITEEDHYLLVALGFL